MVSAPHAGVGWGIAGCGWVARDFAVPAMIATGGRILALHDPDDAAMAGLRGAAPDALACGDLAAFLATPGLQAVYVAAPNHAHRGLVEAAAAAGLAVLCEKPMATSLADARAMLRACRDRGVLYATAFDQRFHPAHVEIARICGAGTLGRLAAIRIVYACWVDAGWAADNWRIDARRAGGGAAFDLAPHGLDLAAMLIGQRLADVAALGQARVHDYPDRGIDDGAMLIARSGGGVLVQLHVAYNCPEGMPRRRLELVGTRGQIVATNTMGQTPGGEVVLIDADGHARPLAIPDACASPFAGQIAAFARSVATGEPFPFDPEEDLHTMALLHAAQDQIAASLAPAAA